MSNMFSSWKDFGVWVGAQLLQFVGQLLLELATDDRVQDLAKKAVEDALDKDLDNDGVKEYADSKLWEEAQELGFEITKTRAEALVRMILDKKQEDGEAPEDSK